MKLAIIGTRGIPASYSGFETSVEETSIRFVKRNIDTTVYCRKYHYSQRPQKYKGINLVYLPSIKTKHLDTFSHTFLSILHAITKHYNNLIIYGIGNAIFIPLVRLFINNIIIVVDGADWERKKWNSFAKKYLILNRYFSVKFSNTYVVDNKILLKNYHLKYGGNGLFIPYGANKIKNFDRYFLHKHGLKQNSYLIFIGRFVKEKNIEFLVNNYKILNTKIKLLIIGGNDIDRFYEKKIKSFENENIIIPGFIYGEEYESLLHGAIFYVSCSMLEGTSPSLLSAMSINGFAIVTDLDENIETINSSCLTYKKGNGKDFRDKIQFYINNPKKVEEQKRNTNKVVDKYYNWDLITKQYCEIFQ